MANLLTESIAAVAAVVVCLLAYATFGEIIGNVLQSIVLDALANPAPGSALELNVGSLLLTSNMVVMLTKSFVWMCIFSVIIRLFLYTAFKSEEVPQ